MKTLEMTGKTVSEALQNALGINLTEDKIGIWILDEEVRDFKFYRKQASKNRVKVKEIIKKRQEYF